MPDPNQSRTQVDALQEILTKQGATEILEIERGGSSTCSILAVREGTAVKLYSVKRYLDEYLISPERRKGTAVVQDLDSLIRLSMRYREESSVIFCNADRTRPELLTVLNYNEIGENGEPRFGDHCVRYPFPITEQWEAWRKHDRHWFDLADFAEFIEDRLLDVMDPAAVGDTIKTTFSALSLTPCGPAELMRVSRGMKIRAEHEIAHVTNLATGECQINFEEKHRGPDGNALVVPGAFVIGIPLFYNDQAYQIAARLRYRLQGGELTWQYSLHRWDIIVDHAIKEACDLVVKCTQIPLYLGNQER